MITTVGVVVPVANEARLLPACLAALERSREELCRNRPVDVRVVIVLDSCTDASERIARSARGVETLAARFGNVGAARRAGCDHLLREGRAPEQVWLASTDADSRVPTDWLTGMVEHGDLGADLVLGTVEPAEDLPPGAVEAYYAGYVFEDGHPHVHGANLGIRASTYLALGGWPPVVTGEDQALAGLARAHRDVHIVRTSRIPVATSTRLQARAPYGYSSHLRRLTTAPGCPS